MNYLTHKLPWAVLITALAVGQASAEITTVTIGGLDHNRVFRPFYEPGMPGNDYYDNIRGLLTDTANFSLNPLDTPKVIGEVEFKAPTGLIDDMYLSDVEIFVMTENKSLMLLPGELTAIQNFVANEGWLVLISDTLHASMGPGLDGSTVQNEILKALTGLAVDPITDNDTVGMPGLSGAQSSTAGIPTNVMDSVVLYGAFGDFTAADDFGATFHNVLADLSPMTQMIGTKSGLGILMEILPESEQNSHSGAVLVAGDVLFSDYFVLPGSVGLGNNTNGKMFLNFVGNYFAIVPEPSGSVLAVIGAIVMAAGREWHRRRRTR